jgi:uncharacterized protein YjbI with pentapeptide repeats
LELVKSFTGCDKRVIHEFGFWSWRFSPEFKGSELKESTQIRSVEIYAHSGSPQDRFIAIDRMQQLSAEELKSAYQQGQRNFQKYDLRSIDLFEAELPAIDLQESYLQAAHLPYADLSQAQLSRLQGQRMELSNAQLYQANLAEANLQEAQCVRCNFRYANLQAADLRHANFSGADLYMADLRAADLRGSDLTNANLDRAQLAGAKLHRANLFRAKGLNLTQALYDRTTLLPDGYRDENPSGEGS